MDINKLTPYIRLALDSIIDQSNEVEPRVIYDYEIIYVKDGSAVLRFENETYLATPGDIYFIRPMQKHSILLDGAPYFHQPHIHFDLFFRDDSPDTNVSFKLYEDMTPDERKLIRPDDCAEPPFDLPTRIQVSDKKYFEELLFELIFEFQMKRPFYEIQLKSLFLKLWTFLLREHYFSKNLALSPKYQELEKIKEYLHAHVREQITLDQLSEKFCISKFHLSRLFKRAFSATPIRYHQSIRIARVKEMLQYTNISLKEVASEFGYKDANTFSRAFRKAEGVPPSTICN